MSHERDMDARARVAELKQRAEDAERERDEAVSGWRDATRQVNDAIEAKDSAEADLARMRERAERAEAEAESLRGALEQLHGAVLELIDPDQPNPAGNQLFELTRKAEAALQSAPPASEPDRVVSYSCLGCGRRNIPPSDIHNERHVVPALHDDVDFCGPIVTSTKPVTDPAPVDSGEATDANDSEHRPEPERCPHCNRSLLPVDHVLFCEHCDYSDDASDQRQAKQVEAMEREAGPDTTPDRPEPSEGLEVWERLRTRLSSSKTWYARDFEATFYDLQILRRHLDADRHSSVPAVPDSLRQLPYLMRSKANGYRTAGGSGLADEVEEWAAEMEQALSDSAQPAPEGWKIVPVVPTDAMKRAGANASHALVCPAEYWRAMIAAAPMPASEGGGT